MQLSGNQDGFYAGSRPSRNVTGLVEWMTTKADDVKKIDLLRMLIEKRRLVVDEELGSVLRSLVVDGLAEKWGIPDMMIHKPTLKGYQFIAEIDAVEQEDPT